MKIAFYTLGCKVNHYETECLKDLFLKKGYDICDFSEEANVYVINTCSVTAVSDRKCRQIIRSTKAQNPNSVMVVTGCYAQNKTEQVEAIDGVDIVTGTTNRNNLPFLIANFIETRKKTVDVYDVFKQKDFEVLSATTFEHSTRATLKIQDGCNNFCTYCIIPYTRGNIRSLDEQILLSEVETLLKKGFKEIVLTGIHLCSYGKDISSSLITILQKIDALPYDFRLRLGSLEPTYFTGEMIKAFSALKSLCPQFHLSLQSGCDKTLNNMGRKYNTQQYKQVVEDIRKHITNATFTTDIIVGFPMEEDDDFRETLDFVSEIRFLHCHIFPYSKRDGTKASTMSGQVDKSVKVARAKELSSLCGKIRSEILKMQIGSTLDVLFEMDVKDNVYSGYTKNYMEVKVKSDSNISLTIQKVKIIDSNFDYLSGILM